MATNTPIGMSQTFNLNRNGLDFLQLDSCLPTDNKFQFDLISNHPKNLSASKYKGGFPEHFSYYFLISDSLLMKGGHKATDIFFATDNSGRIKGIFIEFEHENKGLYEAMRNILGDPAVVASSSIGDQATTNKTLWANHEVRIFLTTDQKTGISMILFYNTDPDGPTPGVNSKMMR